MPIKLMYITNREEIALIAENAGVDRIFIDLETIGKQERQGGIVCRQPICCIARGTENVWCFN